MEIELTVYGIETIAFQNKRVPVPWIVATAPTVYGIETQKLLLHIFVLKIRCNSTYHLRYAPKGARQQRSKATMRSAHHKYLNEVKVKQN